MFATAPAGRAARMVWALVRPHRRRVTVALAAAVTGCLLSLPVPMLVRTLVDVAGTGGRPPLTLAGVGLLVALVAQAGCGLAATVLMGRVGLDVACELRRRVYDRCLRAAGGPAPGVALSHLTDDVACLQNLVSAQSIGALTDLGTAAVGFGWLAWQSPPLAVAAAVFFPVVGWHVRRYGRPIRDGAAEVRGQLDRIFAELKEKLDGAVVVKGHGREAAEEAAFAGRMATAHAPRVRLGRVVAGFGVGGQLIGGLAGLAVFAVGVMGALRGQLSPGEVASAVAVTALVFGPVVRLTDLLAAFEQAAVSGNRLATLLGRPASPVADPPDPRPLGRAAGLIEFDGVGFAYQPGRPVLRDIRLRIEPRERVAVVGPSGCGKSTLLNLLLRTADPVGGTIRLDGVPLRRLAVADLRRQFGLVPQDPAVFRGTLLDNIRYGRPDADPETVEAAARVAGVDELARRLPAGYATLVGEGGHPLSPGETQRVAIARAVCLDPPVVLLDEATSHLDPAAEAAVQAALARLLQGRTSITVTHRLDAARDADRIVVLEGGRVVQTGKHDDLMQHPAGLYHRLVRQHAGLPSPRPGTRLLVSAR